MTPSKDRPDFWGGDVPWVSPKDMKRPILDSSEDYVTALALNSTGLKIQPVNSVLVVTRGMILAHTFPVARNAVPVTINQDMKALRPRAGVSARYLSWMLEGLQPLMLALTEESAHGTKALRTDQWANQAVPVPTLPVQEDIADFLDEKTLRIDALIAEKERLVLAVQEYEQAEVSRLLTTGLPPHNLHRTGIPFVPEAPAHWRLAPFKRAMLSLSQGWSPQCEARPADLHEWGVLKVGCVNGKAFDPTENKALPPTLEPDISCVLRRGDVLVSRANTRELVGMAALVEEDYPNLLLCDKLYRLHLKDDWVIPEFAALALRANPARRQIELGASGASSSMQNISQDVIRELVVAFPPIAEQKALVEQTNRLRFACGELIRHCESHLDRLHEYRSSLISAVVTGQLTIPA